MQEGNRPGSASIQLVQINLINPHNTIKTRAEISALKSSTKFIFQFCFHAAESRCKTAISAGTWWRLTGWRRLQRRQCDGGCPPRTSATSLTSSNDSVRKCNQRRRNEMKFNGPRWGELKQQSCGHQTQMMDTIQRFFEKKDPLNGR